MIYIFLFKKDFLSQGQKMYIADLERKKGPHNGKLQQKYLETRYLHFINYEHKILIKEYFFWIYWKRRSSNETIFVILSIYISIFNEDFFSGICIILISSLGLSCLEKISFHFGNAISCFTIFFLENHLDYIHILQAREE